MYAKSHTWADYLSALLYFITLYLIPSKGHIDGFIVHW